MKTSTGGSSRRRLYTRPGSASRPLPVAALTEMCIRDSFKKGQMIAVQGSIQTRSYEDKQGNKRKAVEISADNVYFADSKGSSQGGQHNNSYGAPDYSSAPAPAAPSFSQGSADDFAVVDDNEDLPF